jgi:phenylpropionate dioxygenase-like ring-hydroxylating dioxygenase large terminal subunit
MKEQVARYDHLYTPEHSVLTTGPVSSEPYISPEYFELEREKVFKKHWSLIGRADDIPDSGDFFVKNIQVLNTSVIIVRGDDGEVRGFHNACCHRGNRVAAGTGNCKYFTCGFHGWSYDNQGQLANIPDEKLYFDLDKSTLNLVPISTATWKGFIFINADPNPATSFIEHLGGLAEQLEPYPFDRMTRVSHYTADVKCNWKVFIDAFQESLHVPYVHNGILSEAYAGEGNPGCRATSFRLYGLNRSHSPRRNRHYTPSPAQGLAYKYALSFSGSADEPEDSAGGYPGINPSGDPDVAFDVNVIFPNSFIDAGGGWYFTYEFWPLAVDETHWEVNLYVEEPQSAAQRVAQSLIVVEFRDGLREDLTTLEATQQGLMSGAVKQLQFSDQELLCRHQYQVVDDIVRGNNF